MIRTTIRRTIRSATLAVAGVSLLLLVIPEKVAGQQPTGAGTQTGPAPMIGLPPARASRTTLADFAWLAGRWQGVWGPRIVQQVWIPPKAGVMLGTSQITENDKTLVIELFSLIEKPEGVELHLRHFTPSLAAWEKAGPAVLRFASADSKTTVFENQRDGEPKRVVIQRINSDTYVSRSEIVPERGDMQVTEITYRRQKDGPPSRSSRR
jgi:Domain of unknown function (DUF6265)